MNYAILFIAVVVSFTLGRASKKNVLQKTTEERKEATKNLKKPLDSRTTDRKEKILELMKSELEHQKELRDCSGREGEIGISRDDVERLLGVSEQTARKYLDELEYAGKIKQIGKSGRGVYYLPTS